MQLLPSIALKLCVALAIGLLFGAERERRKGKGRQRAPAGIRTFAITCVLGAVSLELGGGVLLAVATAAVAGLIAISYARNRQQDPGLTTEAALILTLLLGALALRQPALASALAVVVATLLASGPRLHYFVRSALSERELHDALIFAAAVVVVLPLIPNRYMGPYSSINPHTIWKIVILMMSVSGAGYVAIRVMGAKVGLPLAGLASGFASSTATIGSMGAQARRRPGLARLAVAGAVLSTVATIAEMGIVLTAISPEVFWMLKIPLLAAGGAAAAYGVVWTWRTLKSDVSDRTPMGSAFDPKITAAVAGTVTVVMLISAALNAHLGGAGALVGAAIAGFADTHSAAVSVASLGASGKLKASEAVIPILAGLTTNTVSKLVLSFTAGGKKFATRVAPGLLLVVASAWIAMAIVGRR
jgi:uncharacterized membrane protein (DUF4010 family)